jgi:hypothetical protein
MFPGKRGREGAFYRAGIIVDAEVVILDVT